MLDIPNTEYITISKAGVFVGGKTATKYRGQKISWIQYFEEHFDVILKINPNIAELHVLSSETPGEEAEVGNPTAKHGENAWCRVKFNSGRILSWVFVCKYESADECASYCAYTCLDSFHDSVDIRSSMLGAPKQLITALQNMNLSNFVGKSVKLAGYEIVINKLTETTR